MNQLFKIEFLHNYFSSGAFNGCQLRADSATQEIINRFRLTTRMAGGVFSLYTNSAADPSGTVKYLQEVLNGQSLNFHLFYSANGFTAMTGLPLNWVGQLQFSSKVVAQDDENKLAKTLVPELSARSVFKDDVVALVKIYPEDLLGPNVKKLHYRVSLDARKAHWIYYVINRSQIKLKSPMITNQRKIQFMGPDEITLENGEPALCFNSGKLQFPMQKNPQEIFNLIDRVTPLIHTDSRTIERCLIRGLPTPQDDQLLNVKQLDGSQYAFFAMHVYL